MLAAIRIRGNAKVAGDVEDTLRLMHLNTVNNCAILPKNETYENMLNKAKDLITFGEVNKEIFQKMLLKWGRAGNKHVDEKFFEEKKTSAAAFVDEFFAKKVKLKDFDINPVFRLHPPRKGYEGIKRPYTLGGALGNRGEKINELLERMI